MGFVLFRVLAAVTDNSQWKRSVQDIEGEVLCGMTLTPRYSRALPNKPPVSQFTLFASTKKGNKPDFHGAAKGDHAKELYDYFYSQVQKLYVEQRVKNGVYQAMMEVALVNDGPVCSEKDCLC